MASSTSALRAYFRRCLNPSSHPRAFSSSCRRARNGSLTNFPPSSSPELDTLISNIRQNIFLPNHLVKNHRDLVYRESLRQFITGEEPVTVTMKTVDALDHSKTGEEQVTLTPMNLKEEMSVKRMFQEILPLLRTREDWAVMPAFLREFRASKRLVRQEHISRIIRAAAATGQYGFLIEMVKGCDDTGMVLNTDETAMEVMLLCLHRAYATQWSEKDVERAAKHAHAALWMMKQPQHAPDGVETSQATRPEILGVALAIASIRSSKLKNLEDDDGKVLQYAQDFIASWPKAKFELKSDTLNGNNAFLQQWTPTWLGVQLAQKIVKNVEVQRALKEIFEAKLRSSVQEAVAAMQSMSKAADGRERRGMVIYNALSSVL